MRLTGTPIETLQTEPWQNPSKNPHDLNFGTNRAENSEPQHTQLQKPLMLNS